MVMMMDVAGWPGLLHGRDYIMGGGQGQWRNLEDP